MKHEDGAPYSSDQPEAVRGPWRAVLVDADGMTVGLGVWMTEDWADAGGVYSVGVVRGTAAPADVDVHRAQPMPDTYRPDDVLYLNETLSGADAVARWAQARLIAALLDANQRRLDRELEEG